MPRVSRLLKYYKDNTAGVGSPKTVEDKFLRYVDKDEVTGCWMFTGSLRQKRDGYGRVRSRTVLGTWYKYAHRMSYEWFRGPIPEDMTIDHLCRTVLCVNPWHLEVVTRAENTRRSSDPLGVAPHLWYK